MALTDFRKHSLYRRLSEAFVKAKSKHSYRRQYNENKKAIRRNMNSPGNTNCPKALFVIRDFDHGRYGFQLLNFFYKSGYEIVVVDSHDFLMRLRGYDRMIFDIPGISFCEKINFAVGARDIGVILHAKKNYFEGLNSIKVLNINLDFFNNAYTSGAISIPYDVHPLNNQYMMDFSTAKTGKKAGVLFYGNSKPYTNQYLEKYFKKLSRNQVYSILTGADLPIAYPASYSEFEDMLNTGDTNRVFVFDDSVFRVPLQNWLRTLSQFHFFVATPGQIPVSHNVIEAMSVGTVPITEFAEYFIPGLQDGHNCIAYRSGAELVQKIRDVLKMETNQRNIMSENVYRYFLQHIHPASFRTQVEKMQPGIYDVFFNSEELSLRYLSV